MSNLKVEGKVADFCPKCKNCKGVTKESNGVHVWLTEVECEDPYDGMVKTLDADSNVCCSMFEEKEDKLMQYYRERSKNYEQILTDISRFVPVDVIDFKDLPKIIEQMRKTGDMYDSVSESYDALFDQKYELQKTNEKLEERNNNQFNAIRKKNEEIDHLISLNKELDKKISELEEKLKKANELTDSWKRDYERLRDQFIYPIYNILYPDNPNLDINVTKLLNYVKDLKVYYEENGSMYKEVQEWREKCIARGNDIDHLLSENKEKDKKISELEKLYNSLSETCADYDKRCKEECEKKYRDEISKLQNIVEVLRSEIRGLKKDNLYLYQNKFFADTAMKKNNKLNQTISDQEVTIKALLITIKEMCKED